MLRPGIVHATTSKHLPNVNTTDVILMVSHYTTWNQKWWMAETLCASSMSVIVEGCQSVLLKSSERSCQIWRLHYYHWPLSSRCHYLLAATGLIRQSKWKWWLIIIIYDKQIILILVFLFTFAWDDTWCEICYVVARLHNGKNVIIWKH